MRFISTFGFRVAMLAICAIASSQSAYCTINSTWYIQDGLVAHWDGIDNAGFGLHDANANAWKDLVGGYEFVLSNAIITENGVSFAGAANSFGTLDATGTDATFNIAKNGTLEIVYAKNTGNGSQIILQSTATSGIAYGIYYDTKILAYTGSGNRSAVFSFASGVNTNIVSVKYSSAVPSTIIANGELITPSSSTFWGSPNSTTVIGTRTSKSGNHFNGTIFAIRLYKHQLSDAELAYNAALDRVRYLGGTLAEELPETLPSEYRYNSESGTIECAHTIDFDASKGSVTVDSTVYSERAQLWSPIGISTNITLTATPVAGCEFLYWEGMVPDSDKLNNPLTLTIKDAPHSVTAVFAKIARVAPDATGNSTGVDWENAFTNIQEAIDACGGAGALKIKSGTYIISNELTVAGGDFRFIGGYSGNGDERVGETVISADTAYTEHRIFSVSSSDVYFEALTIANGNMPSSIYKARTDYGQGIALKSCNSVFTNCFFYRNGERNKESGNDGYYQVRGGAIGAENGTLLIYDCRFSENAIRGENKSIAGYGGAVAAFNLSRVIIKDCEFDKNFVQTQHARPMGGGAISLNSCTYSEIDNTTFTTNYARRSAGEGIYGSGNTGYGPHGGTIYISGGTANIHDCAIHGGWNNSYRAGDADPSVNHKYSFGGVMFFTGNAQVQLNRIVVNNAGYSGYSDSSNCAGVSVGSITVASGHLAMTNVIHSASYSGHALGNNGGTIDAVNCTFTGVRNFGNTLKCGYLQIGGSAVFRNCIFWNNAGGEYLTYGGTAPEFYYCIVEGEVPGAYNMIADPLFSDPNYCHPKSTAGRYSGGWFDGGEWVTDEENSPAISSGDPATPVRDEPAPNNERINIGYDGGTALASKWPGLLTVYFADPYAVFTNSVIASADVSMECNVTIVWGENDAGTISANDWQFKYDLGTHARGEVITYEIPNLTAGVTNYCRFVATHTDGRVAWTDTARMFYCGMPPIVSFDPIKPFKKIFRKTATVCGSLDYDGFRDTYVTLKYWDVSKPETILEYKINNGAKVDEGSYEIPLKDLTAGAVYLCRFEAVNEFGTNTTENLPFATIPTTESIVFYVASQERGDGDGRSWENATDASSALLGISANGDEVRLMKGEYVINSAATFANLNNVVIRGGYTGNGDERDGISVIKRDTSAAAHIIFDITKSTVLFDSVEIANGFLDSSVYGKGVSLKSGCDATFTNCIFRNNGCGNNTSDAERYGGAIGVQKGTLRVYDCEFIDNRLVGGSNVFAAGGAIGANGATVIIDNCKFDANYVQTAHNRPYGGGALAFISCSSVDIGNCHFMTNYARVASGNGVYGSDSQWDSLFRGGTIYANGGTIKIHDSIIDGGWCNCTGPALPRGFGGIMAFKSCSEAIVERVAIFNAGASKGIGGNAYNYSSGSIDVHGGKLKLYNVLNANASHGHILGNVGGTIDVINCTFVDSRGNGSRTACGFAQESGTTTFRNSIIWNMKDGFLYSTIGGTVDIANCLIQDGPVGENGNISQDPRLNPAGSEKAYYPGRGSPCIGAGDPSMWTRDDIDLAGNPRRRGGVDIGCYQTARQGFRLIVR